MPVFAVTAASAENARMTVAPMPIPVFHLPSWRHTR
jgi:hypothetical protein